MDLNVITSQIIGAACTVHSRLGPGLLEEPYKKCLHYQLAKQGLTVAAEVPLPVAYDDVTLDCGYRLDLVVEDLIILELKSVAELAPIHRAQLLTYLRLCSRPLGLLLNFNVQRLKNGIVRMVNNPTLRSSATSMSP